MVTMPQTTPPTASISMPSRGGGWPGTRISDETIRMSSSSVSASRARPGSPAIWRILVGLSETATKISPASAAEAPAFQPYRRMPPPTCIRGGRHPPSSRLCSALRGGLGTPARRRETVRLLHTGPMHGARRSAGDSASGCTARGRATLLARNRLARRGGPGRARTGQVLAAPVESSDSPVWCRPVAACRRTRARGAVRWRPDTSPWRQSWR